MLTENLALPKVTESYTRTPDLATSLTLAYVLMAELRKAGLDSWRWRCQVAPSLTKSPLPARLLPGKKAVPSCVGNAMPSTWHLYK